MQVAGYKMCVVLGEEHSYALEVEGHRTEDVSRVLVDRSEKAVACQLHEGQGSGFVPMEIAHSL